MVAYKLTTKAKVPVYTCRVRRLLHDGGRQPLHRGDAEGRAEAIKENARKMKDKNLPVEDIAEITGLTREEIESL